MEGWPDPPFLSVEGPDFLDQVSRAMEVTTRMKDANWDFAHAPEMFSRAEAACDVAAKEIVNVFDGRVQTRWGRLVMKGEGERFNLMSHESPRARYVGGRPRVFDVLNKQVGSDGLHDFAEYAEMRPRQRVEFYNPTV